MSKISEKVRIEWKKGDDARDFGLTTPENITRYDNILYGPDPVWNLLDLYLPNDRKVPKNGFPVIISIHGGGYIYGTKEVYQFYGMSLAGRGFAFVNFNYRLAPEAQFPACLQDTNEVVSWVLSEGKKKYPLDTNNIFIVGDSAGGHMASLYSVICTNKEYADEIDIHPAPGFVPNAVALNCGIYNPLFEIETDSTRNEYTTDLCGTKDWHDIAKHFLCTPSYVKEGFPPTFLMGAFHDGLSKQIPGLEAALNKNCVPHVTKIYGDESRTDVTHVFHCNMRNDIGKICNDEECSFFRKFMK